MSNMVYYSIYLYFVFVHFRMVNEVLADELKVIHAFSQKTLTTEQWNNSNKN